MGVCDSSKTRVVPVFDQLLERDRTGQKWLPKLISLPIGGNRISVKSNCDFGIEEVVWGDKEKRLDPPVALLSWLIRHLHLSQNTVLPEEENPETTEKRRRLIEGDFKLVKEALESLRKKPTKKAWFIFEGQTQPDVFISTPSLIIVIEGKRTEEKPTTNTTWMPCRHQMFRHIDCAWEIRGSRQVIGFFIVEGNGTDLSVPNNWKMFAQNTITEEVVTASLPHRGPIEQQGIASSFAGVTTWQCICDKFGIVYGDLPDKAKLK